MENRIEIYEQKRAIAKPIGRNYEIDAGFGTPVTLKRDVDFGVIPRTKQPSLYKAGAEKIAMGYGLMQRYNIVSKIEQVTPPLLFYTVECQLVKLLDGVPHVITSSFGSANTNESRNGTKSAWDSANGTLKMAQKRALVGAAIALSGLSDMFTQDIENEGFMSAKTELLETDKPDSPVSSKQIQRLYAIGGDAGLTIPEVRQILTANGYASTRDIKQKDYNKICELIERGGKSGE